MKKNDRLRARGKVQRNAVLKKSASERLNALADYYGLNFSQTMELCINRLYARERRKMLDRRRELDASASTAAEGQTESDAS